MGGHGLREVRPVRYGPQHHHCHHPGAQSHTTPHLPPVCARLRPTCPHHLLLPARCPRARAPRGPLGVISVDAFRHAVAFLLRQELWADAVEVQMRFGAVSEKNNARHSQNKAYLGESPLATATWAGRELAGRLRSRAGEGQTRRRGVP